MSVEIKVAIGWSTFLIAVDEVRKEPIIIGLAVIIGIMDALKNKLK